MKRYLKAVALISIMLPYILFLSDDYSRADMVMPADFHSAENTHQLKAAGELFCTVYTQPAGFSGPILPIKYIPADDQKTEHQKLWQSRFDYPRNNDLSLNYPIPTYKISLSVHTSDG